MRKFIILELSNSDLNNEKLCIDIITKSCDKIIFNLDKDYLSILLNPYSGSILITESKYIKFLSKSTISEIIDFHINNHINSGLDISTIDFYKIDDILASFLSKNFNISIKNNRIISIYDVEDFVEFDTIEELCKTLDKDITEYLYV